MTDRGALEAAAAAGVLSAEQIGPLHDFLKARASGAQANPGGEEELRFIRNFHDVFLAIGIVLFAVGMAVGIGAYVAGAAALLGAAGATALAGALAAGAALVMWLLGEFFARRRRLFLPAIAIVMSMTMFAVVAAAALYFGVLLGTGFDADNLEWGKMPPQIRTGVLLATGFAVIAPAAFYARFRLPFSLGMTGAGAALLVIVACLAMDAELTLRLLPALYLTLGALLFLAGVAFDARDPARASRFSDNGFWLHFAAAPMILSGAFGMVGQAFGGDAVASQAGGLIGAVGADSAAAQAGVTLVIVMLLGLVSLMINRRALIVSALITTGVAIGILMNAVGLGEGALAAATLITLGAFVLILGAGWHGARRALLGWVKPDGVWARVFPVEIARTA
jgi:hypothetical protein